MCVIHAHVVYVLLKYVWVVSCKYVVHEYVVYVCVFMCVVQCTYVCGHVFILYRDEFIGGGMSVSIYAGIYMLCVLGMYEDMHVCSLIYRGVHMCIVSHMCHDMCMVGA